MREDEDRELVTLCKKGDVDAFEGLVTKYQKKMLNTAYRMTGNYEDACEVVQDAFVSAYKNMKGFKGESQFSTWLFSICINLSRNRIKQSAAKLQHEDFSLDDPIATEDGCVKREISSEDISVLERLEKKELQERVQDCIKKLGEEYGEVVVLRDMQGFTYEEIRDMLKIPEGTVKSRLFRAREVLRDCLKKAIGEL